MKLSANARLTIVCIALLSLQLNSSAESIPPGIYHAYGRVIKDKSGRIGLFNRGVFHFPTDQDGKLEGHLGQFVDCEHQRLDDPMGFSGSRVGPIVNVKIVALSPDKLPVTVNITPVKTAFEISEPVVCRVELENRSSETRNLGSMTVASTLLCQNYEEKLQLESDMHYYELDTYEFEGGKRPTSLSPGEKISFKVSSSRMAEPGVYEAVHLLNLGPRGLSMQSELTKIVILPADARIRHAALRHWQPVASRDQSIKLASELADLEDLEAFALFLQQLQAGRYSPIGFCYDQAYELAFQKGGQAGEVIMMELIGKQRGQDKVGRMLPGVRYSPRKVDLLLRLLANNQETMRDFSGWVDSPRICDITAGWLAGYTDGKLVFPKSGDLSARDEAVTSIIRRIKVVPSLFGILHPNYPRLNQQSILSPLQYLFPAIPSYSIAPTIRRTAQ